MKPMHILAFRLSALGDVAMTVPVLRLLLQQHPQLQVTIVSVPFHQPLFEGIDRLHFYPFDKKQYKGFTGLFRFAKKLKKDIPFTAVADLHNVLRTQVITRLLFAKRTAVIDKGRKEKKELTRAKNKKLRQLKTTFERYADVFGKLGYPVGVNDHSPIGVRANNNSSRRRIGIAPFAKHNAKLYPLDKMKQVVDLLATDPNNELFIFSNRAELDLIPGWGADNVHLMAGKQDFKDELSLISRMDVMITMDSANMHLASMYGVPVVSVWGGTHPYLGFYGWGQDMGNAVQLDLPCRPSSVFGKEDCPVHGAAGCMQGITPEMIIEKVYNIIVPSHHSDDKK